MMTPTILFDITGSGSYFLPIVSRLIKVGMTNWILRGNSVTCGKAGVVVVVEQETCATFYY